MSDFEEDPFTEEENRKLERDRKRYLANAFITTGIRPGGNARKKRETSAANTSKQSPSVVNDGETPSSHHLNDNQNVICNADHGLIHWATTIHPRTRKFYSLPIKEDSGTEVNWIDPELVRRLACDVYHTDEPLTYHDFHGANHDATQYITIVLKSRLDKTQRLQCFVAPEGFPLPGIVLGDRFMREQGPAQNLFSDRPLESALLVVQAEKKEAEEQQIAALRAEAERRAAALEAQRQAQNNRSRPKTHSSNQAMQSQTSQTSSASSSRAQPTTKPKK